MSAVIDRPVAIPIRCQECKTQLATVGETTVSSSIEGAYLTDDGDTIPGAPREIAGVPAMCLASVGKCPICAWKYWFLEVFLHPAGEDALIDALEQDYGWDATFFVVNPAAPVWSVHRFRSPSGTGWSHNIGPIAAPPAATHGPNGVSSCGGGGFWRTARALVEQLRPQIESAQGRFDSISTSRETPDFGPRPLSHR